MSYSLSVLLFGVLTTPSLVTNHPWSYWEVSNPSQEELKCRLLQHNTGVTLTEGNLNYIKQQNLLEYFTHHMSDGLDGSLETMEF